jgi:RNA polymerase sigma-70 factor (ECF subfamily)
MLAAVLPPLSPLLRLHTPGSTLPACTAMTRPVPSADDHCVQAIRGGNTAAYADIVSRHRGRVLQMASRFARNHHEQDDLAQEIFVRAWRGLHTWRGDAPFEHWLMRLAVRCCHDFLRSHRSRREREVSHDLLAEHGLTSVEPSENPAETAMENAALLLVRRAMRYLKPKEQLVLTLLELEERPVRETAALTGWSEANVKVRAHRARLRLRDVIEKLRAAGHHEA